MAWKKDSSDTGATLYHLKEKDQRENSAFSFFICVLQAATSEFLWCGSVLVDGDWYLCCGLFDTGDVRICVDKEMSQTEINKTIHLEKPINGEKNLLLFVEIS